MKLRTRLLLESGILLLIALVGNYVLVALLGYRAMREQAMERASALAAVLNAVGEQGLRVEAAADRLLGEQMVVQAYLAAHLVDLAENYAHLSAAEIKTRLKDVADHTVLDEFWITDEKGHAYLRNVEDIDFTFPSEPTERNQAWRFSGLLGEDHGQLAQAAMRREYDGRTFKYAAVSGIDRPRIVQVGYEAESLSRLVAGMRAADLARATRGAGRIERICAVGAGGELYMDTELPGQPEQGQRVRDEKLLATVAKAQQEGVPVVQTAGDYLTVASPARAPDGSPYTLLTTFNAAPMLVRMRRTLWSLVLVSGAAVLVGLALAWHGSASIARPLEALALEAAPQQL